MPRWSLTASAACDSWKKGSLTSSVAFAVTHFVCKTDIGRVRQARRALRVASDHNASRLIQAVLLSWNLLDCRAMPAVLRRAALMPVRTDDLAEPILPALLPMQLCGYLRLHMRGAVDPFCHCQHVICRDKRGNGGEGGATAALLSEAQPLLALALICMTSESKQI